MTAKLKRKTRKARSGFRLPLWLTIVITASGWAAAVAVWVLDFPGKINSFSTEYPKAAETVSDWLFINKTFTGTWTSSVEGWVDATDEDHRLEGGEAGPIVIQIRVYGGKADGEIVSEGLKKHYLFSRIFLMGEYQGGRIEGLIFDYVEGKKVALARIEISHLDSDGDDTLRFKALEQPAPFFPNEARLHRDKDAMPDDLGGANLDLILKALTKSRDDAKTKDEK